jgi:hypothetical protein
MNVISASRRTDIPAFHSRWFMNRVRDGYARVVSPFGGGQFMVSLVPDDVIAFVFWTKNAAPMIPNLQELVDLGHCFTFLYTINGYPRFMEPGVPEQSHTLCVLEAMAKRFPQAVIRWRYDTIVLTEELDRRWHIANFRNLCEALSPFTNECIFSFCDYYKKTISNMKLRVPDHKRPDENQCREIADEMAEIAAVRSIRLLSCAHEYLESDRIGKARCIDPVVLAKIVDTPSRAKAVGALKKSPSRKGCNCAASRDIGAYDTCPHGCVYCYANTNPERAKENLKLISTRSDCLNPRVAGVQG